MPRCGAIPRTYVQQIWQSAGVSRHPTLTAGPDEWLNRVRAGRSEDPVTHVERLPARPGVLVDWPGWTPPVLRDAFVARGVTRPWAHQVAAAEMAASGESVVIATGTASGKSLAYQLPTLTALLSDARATALYLSPTKALAADQLRGLLDVADAVGGGIRPALYDGDTADAERDWVRAHSRLVLTNPDMLHRGILPRHDAWASFLRRLRFVVIDECHAYRGVFGSHVAHVLRRLRRLCARYRSAPVFVLASATVADPRTSGAALIGAPLRAVTEDGSPRGATTFALWEPPVSPFVGERGAPVRRTATAEAADLLADLVAVGARTLAFVRSRRGAEAVALGAKRALAEAVPELVDQVDAYRAGYLADDRRELEAALRSGALRGLASTNALELGVDVTGLDAVVLTGYPGRLASLWQQAGRAGRGSRDALAVLVARDDPLDSYLVHHPSAVFGRPVEATVLDPTNPYVLGPQLACAAAELPLTEADLPLFGGAVARAALDGLVDAGVLRRRPAGWYWTSRGRPDADLRGTGGEPVSIVEASTGRLLGTVDAGSAPSSVHTGAVHLHRGETFVVDELDLENLVALVRRAEPDWYTQSRDVTDLSVVSVSASIAFDGVELSFGTVDVTNQVVSYVRRRIATGEVLDEQPLDLPERRLRTRAVWYTMTDPVLTSAGVALEEPDIGGAAHAAEHAAIGLLPLVASCDRWDIGGLSTASHQDTGLATVFVYDGHPGGAGFAERGFAAADDWLTATRDAISACECAAGCPSCVHSPKCGNGNDPLDKAGAVRLLTAVVDRVRHARAEQSTFGHQVGGQRPL
ncbi:DEAD/DEAH box helicase [Cryptosporangium sp. NPDC051539]|uniref:DEAD/DEAH box helicase n=1 Tax=Cryptosporangium sp. NPDC051539 TaxID=3363962 RepID=UPI0037A9C7DC